MPYSPTHKAETRARIVACARRMFNRQGFDAVSIDEIMAVAGLTRGGFYNHFKSKDELYSEAVASSRADMRCKSAPPEVRASARTIAGYIVQTYLSRQHLDDIEGQCPLIALPSDVARASSSVRDSYQELLEGMIEIFETAFDAEQDARRKALGMAILCVGGMVLARTIDDEALRDEVCETAFGYALDVGDLPHKAEREPV